LDCDRGVVFLNERTFVPIGLGKKQRGISYVAIMDVTRKFIKASRKHFDVSVEFGTLNSAIL
jgi:hypothetical protein